MRKIISLVALSLLWAAAAAAQTGAVEVRNAWTRATPGKAENGSAYLTIVAPAGDRLIGLETPIAGKAELHESKMEGGIMKMRPLAGIDLPAGQPVALKPGGVHVMLVGLKQPLHAGDTFPLTLDFAKAGKREVRVSVEKMSAMGPADHAGGDMHMPAAMPGRH